MWGKFYVYEHVRPDRDEVFYVGKGKGRRANEMNGRNRHHKAIQAKLSRLGMAVEVRMVAMGMDEEYALALEVDRIAFWRADGVDLANLTSGGDTGNSPSEETRAIMRARKLGRKLTEEHKAKIAKASKEALARPEVKAKLSASLKISLNTPEAKARASKHFKEMVRTDVHRAKIAASKRGKKLSPEHAEKSRKASLGRKQTQEEIDRRRSVNTGKKRTPEFCERMRQLNIGRKRTPEFCANMKKVWSEKVERERSMGTTRIISQEEKEHRSASIKAGWARRKEMLKQRASSADSGEEN